MSKDKIILFDDKKNCCACGACMNVCPKDAIRMEEDEYGFYIHRLMRQNVFSVELVRRFVLIRMSKLKTLRLNVMQR